MSLVWRVGLPTVAALTVSSVKVDPSKYLSLWAFMYETAAPHSVRSALGTVARYGSAAYLYEGPAENVRPWLYRAGALCVANIPYTLATSDTCAKKRARYVATGALPAEDAEDSRRRIRMWKKQHLVRVSLGQVEDGRELRGLECRQ
ncbi:hypothetical protein HDZ31DRAFT_81617 [Schizophyllum fasciatum]